MNQTVVLQQHPQDSRIAILEFNRPDNMNALNVQLAKRFMQLLNTVSQQSQYRILLLRGRGNCFMAGGDLQYFAKLCAEHQQANTPVVDPEIFNYINNAVQTLASMPQITIAQVHGATAGIGISFMLGCDLAISSSDAIFNCAYSNIAITADGGISYNLPRIVGRHKALELLLLSPRLSATEALQLGLLNRLYAPQELPRQIDLLMQQLLAKSVNSQQQMKHLIRSATANNLAQQLELEAQTFVSCSADSDFAEGVNAFLERRQANFKTNSKNANSN